MFRSFLFFSFLCCFVAARSFSATATPRDQLKAYLDKGCPAPQHAWTGADYEALEKLIEAGTIPLPRANDPVLSPIFKRMINPQNLEVIRRDSSSMSNVFRNANELGAALPPLIVRYRKAVANGVPVEDGVAALTAVMLNAAATSYAFAPDASDLDQKLPDDEREKQSAARDNMREQLLHLFDGAIQSIERGSWSNSSRIVFAKAVAESLPLVRAALPPSALKNYKARLEACRQRKNSAELNQALDQAIAASVATVILNT